MNRIVTRCVQSGCVKCQPVLEGRSQLPQDVLVHVFGFLDLKSVLTASLVCRSWSVAASDNYLWQLIHISFFGKSSDNPNIIRLTYGVDTPVNTVAANLDWKDAFKQAYRGISIKATSQRDFCKRCKSFVWLSNSKCSNGCYGKISDEHQIMPVSLKQIVDYVTMEYSIPCLDCDRDSDDSVDGLDYSVYLDDSDDSVVGSPY
ncbi:F-box protein like [Capsicum galapagoense]